jgi:hypothetical protein
VFLLHEKQLQTELPLRGECNAYAQMVILRAGVIMHASRRRVPVRPGLLTAAQCKLKLPVVKAALQPLALSTGREPGRLFAKTTPPCKIKYMAFQLCNDYALFSWRVGWQFI